MYVTNIEKKAMRLILNNLESLHFLSKIKSNKDDSWHSLSKYPCKDSQKNTFTNKNLHHTYHKIDQSDDIKNINHFIRKHILHKVIQKYLLSLSLSLFFFMIFFFIELRFCEKTQIQHTDTEKLKFTGIITCSTNHTNRFK